MSSGKLSSSEVCRKCNSCLIEIHLIQSVEHYKVFIAKLRKLGCFGVIFIPCNMSNLSFRCCWLQFSHRNIHQPFPTLVIRFQILETLDCSVIRVFWSNCMRLNISELNWECIFQNFQNSGYTPSVTSTLIRKLFRNVIGLTYNITRESCINPFFTLQLVQSLYSNYGPHIPQYFCAAKETKKKLPVLYPEVYVFWFNTRTLRYSHTTVSSSVHNL